MNSLCDGKRTTLKHVAGVLHMEHCIIALFFSKSEQNVVENLDPLPDNICYRMTIH